MIVLKPKGGLCNRLRAIDSGIVLSNKINKPLKILWTLSPELNCSFYSLFKPSEHFTVVDIREKDRPSSILMNNLFFLYDFAMAKIQYRRVIFQKQMNRLRRKKYDFTQLGRYASVYITCCSRFYRIDRKYQSLRPVETIEKSVNRITEGYSSHAVGVHIRRTDHHKVSPYSSTRGFIDAMNKQIEKNSDTKFYLATDSPDVISQLTRIFGDRIICRNKDYSRNSEEGIKDALIDLLCLSKTRIVIGSHSSSFSETAAQLNDIPAIYIKSESGVKT